MESWTTKRSEFASFLLMRDLDPVGIRLRIRQARNALGLTQQGLADALQVHKRTIENYENVRVPPWEEFTPLADVLGVSIAWLLHGDTVIESDAEKVDERLTAIGELLRELLRLLQGELPEDDAPSRSYNGESERRKR